MSTGFINEFNKSANIYKTIVNHDRCFFNIIVRIILYDILQKVLQLRLFCNIIIIDISKHEEYL